jgi:hypothetical protein
MQFGQRRPVIPAKASRSPGRQGGDGSAGISVTPPAPALSTSPRRRAAGRRGSVAAAALAARARRPRRPAGRHARRRRDRDSDRAPGPRPPPFRAAEARLAEALASWNANAGERWRTRPPCGTLVGPLWGREGCGVALIIGCFGAAANPVEPRDPPPLSHPTRGEDKRRSDRGAKANTDGSTAPP